MSILSEMQGRKVADWEHVVVEPDGRRPELEFPNLRYFATTDFIVPFVLYFGFFRLLSWTIKTYFWQTFTEFKRYRLHNLSVCFAHSLIAGVWCACFVVTHPYEMFHNYVYYYEPWAAQIAILSVAYFLHDAIDMLRYEWSKWTRELLLHHVMTGISLLTPLPNRRFLIPVYWALQMEINSIFLHARTIMQLSGYNTKLPDFYRAVVYANIFSFVTCRFVSMVVFQYWTIWWFVLIGCGGPFAFHTINAFLFFRVLAADGFLGEKMKSRAAINRDDQKLTNGPSLLEKQQNGNAITNGHKNGILATPPHSQNGRVKVD
ncbi:hypothetical protein WR25_19166 isoform B [Diploscapter pachys]|uniref:TLC domain-containing protein n=1 Tax=Diploscapter pachys TaxID=2018661 RepID=A0A2A2KHD0_9BILA|nr:hypothetical protein WR25_19166 isoform B [Diploscapter pachys]